jgi:hypothetical protein
MSKPVPQSLKMSLFSPLFMSQAAAWGRKRCRIKGLSAKSRVIYQDLHDCQWS